MTPSSYPLCHMRTPITRDAGLSPLLHSMLPPSPSSSNTMTIPSSPSSKGSLSSFPGLSFLQNKASTLPLNASKTNHLASPRHSRSTSGLSSSSNLGDFPTGLPNSKSSNNSRGSTPPTPGEISILILLKLCREPTSLVHVTMTCNFINQTKLQRRFQDFVGETKPSNVIKGVLFFSLCLYDMQIGFKRGKSAICPPPHPIHHSN